MQVEPMRVLRHLRDLKTYFDFEVGRAFCKQLFVRLKSVVFFVPSWLSALCLQDVAEGEEDRADVTYRARVPPAPKPLAANKAMAKVPLRVRCKGV